MFWDSSALVALLVKETHTVPMTRLAREEREMTIWWATPVECQTAIARRHRERPVAARVLEQITVRISELSRSAGTVAATEEVRARARRLATSHALRAADALQLAAALVWCGESPTSEGFVCLDARLREAARREGFALVPAGL